MRLICASSGSGCSRRARQSAVPGRERAHSGGHGRAVRQRGAYRLTRRPDTLEIPASVAAIIGAHRPARRRRQGDAAAGRGDRRGGAAGTPGSRHRAAGGGAARRARRPAGRELLYEARLFPDIAYAFRHGLTRRVAYDGLVQESRRALHARVAAAIEARHADHLDEVVEMLAHHFEHGAVWAKAAAYFLRAAARRSSATPTRAHWSLRKERARSPSAIRRSKPLARRRSSWRATCTA